MRVVITGLGTINALATNVPDYWKALRAGKPGITDLRLSEMPPVGISIGAQIPDFSSCSQLDCKTANQVDRFAHLAIEAAGEALMDANLPVGLPQLKTACLLTGSCVGGQTANEKVFTDLYVEGKRRASPLTVPMVMANAAASQISMLFGITGPTLTISTACASSAHAIGMAYWMVRQGIASLAVTGGSESAFAYGHLKAWEALRVVAPDTCRPFSKGRKGMVLGEGAAMLVLEPLDTALARGAHIHAEIVGFGMSADASHLTLPNPQGAASAMQAALADAEVQPRDIDYINAHGTGTLANDASEARAIHQVFGPSAVQLAVSSTKSMHGHTLGAAGALEAVATVLALENQFLPPTINHLEADEACELDVIPNIGRTAELGHALSNSFAFGGLNAVLAFRRWENE